MPNNYFNFKQFTIYQDKCSMKVCTDACIFGAWVASIVASGRLAVNSCLDIGTGTGLLSLMLAQKNNFEVEALEIEPNAYEQAKENFQNSPWNDRLKIFNADAKDFISSKRYDLIISNPPFFENDLLSGTESRNIAKHNAGLRLQELLLVIKTNVSSAGYFAILLPYQRTGYFENLAYENDFFIEEKVLIRQSKEHTFFRSVSLFSNRHTTPVTSGLTIKNKEGNYTQEFTTLLRDYYLYL